jgi:hypothetical protein
MKYERVSERRQLRRYRAGQIGGARDLQLRDGQECA